MAQIATLNEKIAGLTSDKMLLMDRCEAAIHASHAHAQGERNERLEKERVKRDKEQLERNLRLANEQHERDMRELRKKYECVKGKYKALKASCVSVALCTACRVLTHPLPRRENAAPTAMVSMKRKSTHSPGFEPEDDAEDVDRHAPRAQRRIPKRPRLLGSPFDLTRRIERRPATAFLQDRTGPRTRSQMLLDEDEDDLRDSDLDPVLDASASSSSSIGPQHSGLPTGDIFSPRRSPSLSGGRSSVFDFEVPLARSGSRMRTRLGLGGPGPAGLWPAWMLSPEEHVA